MTNKSNKSALGGGSASDVDDIPVAERDQGEPEQERSRTPQQLVVSRLNTANMVKQFAVALGTNMKAERFVRIAGTEIQKNEKLALCDWRSLATCLMNLAALGLEPGGPLAMAYLIPRKKKGVRNADGSWNNDALECTAQISYRGLMTLARRSGDVLTIDAEVVRRNDLFKVTLGLNRDLVHEPAFDDSEVTHVYASAQLLNGGHQFVVMTKAQIDAHASQYSDNSDGKNSPWVTAWEAMAKKTVLRQLYKFLPVSTEMADSARAEDDNENVINGEFTVVTEPQEQN